MSEIKFLLQFAQSGQLGKTIKEVEKLNELLRTNTDLQKIVSIESKNAADVIAKEYADVTKKQQELQKNISSSNDTKHIMALTAEISKLRKEYDALSAKVAKTAKDTKTLTEQDIRSREEKKKANAVIREQIKNEEALSRAKEALIRSAKGESRTIRQLKQDNNDLVRARELVDRSNRKGVAEFDRLSKAINKNETELRQLDAQIQRYQRNVGNYQSAFKGLGSTMLQLAGIGGGIYLLTNAFRSAANVIKNFDQAQADLQAISGKSEKELAGLTAQAKELGATTQFTASEITQLQIELAKLGFNTDQISKATKPISDFAAATGAEIPRAAALAGSALRAFGLDAKDMSRVVSTLGVATTKTGLDFSFLETAMSTVAPVAKAFGFSIEDTTALLGQLANSGFDASSAATATRNILLNLADANGKLAKELGRPIKSIDDLAGGLKELQDKGIDLATSLELTDKRSVAAFQTFVDGSGSLVELRQSITGVDDELKRMAEKRLNSVEGATKLLTSAWEGYILKVNDANGASNKIKKAIKFLANNLETILNIVIELGKAWLIYKATILATNLIMQAMKLKEFVAGLFSQAKATKLATEEQKKLNASMKANVIGLAVVVIYELVSALTDYETEADRAAAAQERLNAAVASVEADFSNYKESLRSRVDAIREYYGLLMKEATANKKSTKELEVKSLEEQQKVIDDALSKKESALEAHNAVLLNSQTKLAQLELELLQKKNDLAARGYDENHNRTRIALFDLQERVTAEKHSVVVTEKIIKEINKAYEEGEKLKRSLSADTKITLNNHQEELTAKQKSELEKRLQLERDYRRKLQDLIAINNNNEFERQIAQENLKFKREKNKAKKEITNKKLRDAYIEQLEIEHQENLLKIDKEYSKKKNDDLNDQIGKIFDADQKIADNRVKINDAAIDEELDRRKAASDEWLKYLEDKQKEQLEQLVDFSKQTIQLTLQAAQDAAQKSIEKANEALDKQKTNVQTQADLAARGLENTLAFEKEIQAQRERDLLAAERRAERLKKIETYYSLLSSYAETDPNTAPAKALIQIGIAEAIASRFEDGGVVSDVVAKQNGGILRGPRHRNGGILIEAEGDEGIFSRKEMANLGKENFYTIKSALQQPVEAVRLGSQNQEIMSVMKQPQVNIDLNPLRKELQEVKKAINDKPSLTSLHIDQHGNLITREEAKGIIKTTVKKRKGFN